MNHSLIKPCSVKMDHWLIYCKSKRGSSFSEISDVYDKPVWRIRRIIKKVERKLSSQ